jgi:hypothetical protein
MSVSPQGPMLLHQGSKAAMHLQGHVPPQGPPHLQVHSLNPSVLKYSVILHERN